jgi:hypothetical protein
VEFILIRIPSFDWILGHVQDGTKQAAPREVIHLLTEAKTAQIARLARGGVEPPGTKLFSALAFRDATTPVSNTRLEGAAYADYPDLRPFIEALDEEKAEQTLTTLMTAWPPQPTSRQTAVVTRSSSSR